MLCETLNCLSQSAVFPSLWKASSRSSAALSASAADWTLPWSWPSHEPHCALKGETEEAEASSVQRSFTKCRRTQSSSSGWKKGPFFQDSEKCPRNEGAGRMNAVWPTYLQRNLMEGKFISPTAIRVLCFTSCLVKQWSVSCPPSRETLQKTLNKASVWPTNFSVCSNQISFYISMPAFDGFTVFFKWQPFGLSFSD